MIGTPLRVLIAEDLEDDAMFVVQELRRGGYDPAFERVETAEAMAAALDRQSWDVVISDYAMPHFSARAALALLKKRELDLPFIVVSGAIGEDVAVLAMKAGAHDYVMKGNLTRLDAAVERELAEAKMRREHKRAERQLLADRVKLRSLASQLSLVEERQRRKIAMALHDGVGQNLALTQFKLEKLKEAATGAGLAEPLAEIRGLLRKTIQHVRSMTFELSPPALYDLGFEAAAEGLVERFRGQYGIEFDFQEDGHPKPLDDDVRVTLFQGMRELLVNVVKHTQARHAHVSIRKDRNKIRVCVADDGVGFNTLQMTPLAAHRGGFGLFSLRERLTHLGGKLVIESRPGHGSQLTLVAPLKRERQTGTADS